METHMKEDTRFGDDLFHLGASSSEIESGFSQKIFTVPLAASTTISRCELVEVITATASTFCR
jgi:hypothetical protein